MIVVLTLILNEKRFCTLSIYESDTNKVVILVTDFGRSTGKRGVLYFVIPINLKSI